MIKSTRKTATLKESNKDYFIVFVDNEPVGVIVTSKQDYFHVIWENLVEKYNAIHLSESVCQFTNESGVHLLWLKPVKKISFK